MLTNASSDTVHLRSAHPGMTIGRACPVPHTALQCMTSEAAAKGFAPLSLGRWMCSRFENLLGLGAGALLLLSIVSGCATLEVVPAERLQGHRFEAGTVPVAHIYADNWGLYLFKYIPLITGNLERPGMPRLPSLFADNVRVDLLVEQVAQEGRNRGASLIADLRTRDRSYYMPWTLILWLNEFEVSANVSHPTAEGGGNEHASWAK